MEEHIDKLARLLVRIRTPLSMAGLAFVVLYLIYRQVLGLDVFAQLDQEATFRILNQVIGSLFWLAMVALILGVLAYLLTPMLRRKASRRYGDVELIDASPDPQLKIVAGAPPTSPPPPPSQAATAATAATAPAAATAAPLAVEDIRSQAMAVDFKFVNRGDAAAVLRAFWVQIVDAKPDVTPKLVFSYETSSTSLRISAVNLGWGPARALSCDLSAGDPLSDLFPARSPFQGELALDAKGEVLALDFKSLDRKRFRRLLQESVTSASTGEHGDGSIPVELKLDVQFTDEYGDVAKYTTGDLVRWPDKLLLSERGFEYLHREPPSPAMMYSREAYAVRLDADDRDPKRYRISRKIPQGDAERFHILLACERSGRFLIRFGFEVDRKRTVAADPMWVDLRHTNRWFLLPPEFVDGTTLAVEDGVVTLGKAPPWNERRR